MSMPIDSHLRSCITAAAQFSTSGELIPLPPNLASLPFLEDEVDLLADLAMAKDPVDEQVGVGVSEGVWFKYLPEAGGMIML